MKRPWDEYIFRPLLHKSTRLVWVLLAVVLVYRWLAAYPWWLWLPACLLGAFVAVWVWLMLSYAYQKVTYPRRAAECKRRRHELRGE